MTTATVPPRAPAAPAPQTAKPPVRLFLTILQLAGLGILGVGVIGVLTALLGTGIGLLFVFGVGVFVLAGFAYALFGTGWFEIERANGLYRLDVPSLAVRRRTRPGFSGWLRQVGTQAIDGRMWRAVASFVIASIIGGLVLRLVNGFLWSVILLFAPLGDAETVRGPYVFGTSVAVGFAPLIGVLGILASAAGVWGLALLSRKITIALISRSRTAELSERVQETTAQREGAVRAADVERTRIERDLHDGVQPRLVSVGMTLGLAQQKIDTDPAAAKELISEAHTSTKAAITELRQLARGIHASVLDDRGLDAALSALAGRSHIPVHLDVRLEGRCSRDAEAAVYFAIAESLTNAAKHSRASECRVIVRVRDGGTLWARVEDNGVGGAQVQPGGGLDGITNRILAARGTFRLDSPTGGPTSLEVSVPCAS